MIRLFLFSRPLPHLTREQFQSSLLHDHAPMVRSCEGYVRPTKGYMQNHFAMQVDAGKGQMLVREPRFDNCSEFWYDEINNILQSYNNDDYFRVLRPDENTRTDKATRVALIAEDSVVYQHPQFRAEPMMPKVVVLSKTGPRGLEQSPGAPAGLQVRCLRKTVNRILGEFDFFNAKLADGVTSEFDSVTTFTLAQRLPDGSEPSTGELLPVFDSQGGSEQFALWSRSHQIIGNCA